MKSIGFIMLHFLIFCPSLSRLALYIERITVKTEMVGSNHSRCCLNVFKNLFCHFFYRFIFFFVNYFACNLLMSWSVNNNKKARHIFN